MNWFCFVFFFFLVEINWMLWKKQTVLERWSFKNNEKKFTFSFHPSFSHCLIFLDSLYYSPTDCFYLYSFLSSSPYLDYKLHEKGNFSLLFLLLHPQSLYQSQAYSRPSRKFVKWMGKLIEIHTFTTSYVKWLPLQLESEAKWC